MEHRAAIAFQTPKLKGQANSKWSLVSIPKLQRRQVGGVCKPQPIILSLVGHLLSTKSQVRKHCLGIPLLIHTAELQFTFG
ncbi:hypothetical protein Bca101_030966 [Brassica carinata]